MKPVVFPYKEYKLIACPIVTIEVQGNKTKKYIDAYVDSGASISIFSIQEAIRLGINYQKGKEIFITVGDGSSIPVHLHNLSVRVGDTSFRASIGFSPRLGVGFNLIGRKDFFANFDITFSDSTKTVTFLPVNK
jgi:hypothetical protein